MFVVIRRYRLTGPLAEANRRIEADLLPQLRNIAGFKQYYTFATPDGAGVSVSVFATEAAARSSSELAVAWARENLADLIDGDPTEVITGEMKVAVSA